MIFALEDELVVECHFCWIIFFYCGITLLTIGIKKLILGMGT